MQVERLQEQAVELRDQLENSQPVMATVDKEAIRKKEALEVRLGFGFRVKLRLGLGPGSGCRFEKDGWTCGGW